MRTSSLLRHLIRRVAIAACATPLLASAGAFGAAHAADTVDIGLLSPLTGPASADGQEFQRGAQMAVDEVNAAGGIDGHLFKLVVADVKDQSAGSVTSAVERLLDDKNLHFVMTGYASTTNFEIESMAEANVPYVLAGSSQQTRDIIGPDPGKFDCCWSWTPSYDPYNTGVVAFIDKLVEEGKIKLSNKKLAIISSDNAYSKGISEGMKKAFAAQGWTVGVDELVPFGDVTDWHSILAKVRSVAPDVVINTDYQTGNAASFLSQFLEQPTNSLLFLQYAPSVPEFVKLSGPKANGVIYDLLGGSLNTPKNPRAAEVAKKFKDKYGIDTGLYGAALYEIANLYFDAVRKVGRVDDHAAIMKALGQTDKKTVAGRLKFDPKTHLAMAGDDFVPLTFWQIVDGERKLIAPADYAVASFQPQPWMK
jgi:branched-chain amino acid transport system substrate-binding protein